MKARIIIRKIQYFLLITFVISLGTIALAKGFNTLFSLKEIEVIGEGIAIQVDKSRLGQNLLFIKTPQLEENLKRLYPLLSSVAIQKKYPHTLIIKAAVRSPVARLTKDNLTVVVDKDGYVLAVTKDRTYDELPLINIEIPLFSVGKQIEFLNVLGATSLVAVIDDIISVDRVSFENNQIYRVQAGSLNILFTQNTDIQERTNTLQTLIKGFRIKGKLPAIIDLRFEKPYITY